MSPKSKEHRNGWFVSLEKACNGWYLVNVRRSDGELHDKVRCDDYRDACNYYKSFNAIARNA